jgi:hypothetical protein
MVGSLLRPSEPWLTFRVRPSDFRDAVNESTKCPAPGKDIFDRLKPSDFTDQPQKPP